MQWRNWDGRVRCEPQQYLEPATEQEAAELLARVAGDGRHLRVAGSGHSFTPLVRSNDVLVSVRKLRGIIKLDRDRQEVEVGAGTVLRDLSPALAQEGFALENLGDIDEQTVAGAISTGTHGTGLALGGLASGVTALRIATTAGTLVDIDGSDIDRLQAAVVSLGALGILTRIRIKVVPRYRLKLVARRAPLSEALDHCAEWARHHRHFEFFWFPHSDQCQLKFTDISDEPLKPRSRRSRMADDILETGVFGSASALCRFVPAMSPALSRFAGRFVSEASVVDESYCIFASNRKVRFHETEYALPLDAAIPALTAIQSRIAEKNYRVHFPVEVRFGAADSGWLSLSHGRPSCYIAVHMAQGMDFREYFADMEAIFSDFDGRPHWGKRHSLQRDDFTRLYPRFEDFNSLREEFDPDMTLLNNHLRTLFTGP
ncbi:MAG: D-arabinono-1,4-lactone oxidase [Spirochaetaceae bacterium]